MVEVARKLVREVVRAEVVEVERKVEREVVKNLNEVENKIWLTAL